jgi:predicted Zn-dependent protease
LTESVGLDPYFEPAVMLFAEMKIRKGSPAAAIDALRDLLNQRQQSPQGYWMLATAYLAQQQQEGGNQLWGGSLLAMGIPCWPGSRWCFGA